VKKGSDKSKSAYSQKVRKKWQYLAQMLDIGVFIK